MSLENRYNIAINAYTVGNDYFFLVTGGQSHIGASATSYWEQGTLRTSLIELPHHKEGELAKECAELAAKKLNCTCTVVMGIHIDDATKDDINYIVAYVRFEFVNLINNID